MNRLVARDACVVHQNSEPIPSRQSPPSASASDRSGIRQIAGLDIGRARPDLLQSSSKGASLVPDRGDKRPRAMQKAAQSPRQCPRIPVINYCLPVKSNIAVPSFASFCPAALGRRLSLQRRNISGVRTRLRHGGFLDPRIIAAQRPSRADFPEFRDHRPPNQPLHRLDRQLQERTCATAARGSGRPRVTGSARTFTTTGIDGGLDPRHRASASPITAAGGFLRRQW